MRGATLFSGGGGVEALLKDCINFVHAVEYDPAIAAVYRANHGDHIQVAKVEDVDYSLWGHLDYLHASPVCKEYSQAKTGGAEGAGDISSALAVVRCIEATTPRVFTLENVGAYQHGTAYRLICQALDRAGYMWYAEVLNAADYGVPQTRRRLILRAVRDSLLPGLPAPVKWVGWYAAIEDLIPTLPASQFAPWQLVRLPEYVVGAGFLMQSRTDDGSQYPRLSHEPTYTVCSESAYPKCFIIDGKPANYAVDLQVMDATEPVVTLTASQPRHPFRAWLSQGRVVKMTPRALARFQSLPDSYQLPDRSSLACTIIGNMAPSLLMREIVRPLL